jgi:hypothetical protein
VSAFGLWATPAASDSSRGGQITDKMTGQSLVQMVNTPKYWPTPTVQDAEQAGGKGCIASGKRGLSLHQATQQFPTSMRSDYKSGSFSQGGRDKRDSHTRGKPLNETIGGQLNPNWVEWLMGWPIGHTDLKPLATARYQEWQQQHGSC